jgi:hypothetical protein
MARVGSQAAPIWLRDVLRQDGAEYPNAKLDEIADSLLARAIDPASVQQRGEAHTRAVNALNLLAQAGGRASSKGRPYVGALDRMMAVHRRAPSRQIRARALGAMLVIPARSRAVDYLRDVAESTDSTAYDAVEFLITDANGGSWTAISPTVAEQQQSISALKALASGGRVTDDAAAKLLELWIQRYRSEHPSQDGS